MKIVFFGTPDYVLPVLNSLHREFKQKTTGSPIVAVVTQKPKPAGRKKHVAYSAVDKWAHAKKIPTYYDYAKLIEEIEADFGILASYGSIIPKRVIEHFPHGILNIHPSALPEFRGTSPVQATLVSGKDTTNVTIMLLDEKLDHGPIISQFTEEILLDDTTGSLRTRLFTKSAEVLITLLPAFISGKITPKKQNHEQASYTTLVNKSDAFIPPKYLASVMERKPSKDKWEIGFLKNYILNPNPHTLDRFIRAMQPWPQAWTKVKLFKDKETKRLKILKAHIEDKKLVLDEVQLEGKNPVSWQQFTRGYPNAIFE